MATATRARVADDGRGRRVADRASARRRRQCGVEGPCDMDELQAQRRLVKSPPELWAEISDEDVLRHHLAPFGAVRITSLDQRARRLGGRTRKRHGVPRLGGLGDARDADRGAGRAVVGGSATLGRARGRGVVDPAARARAEPSPWRSPSRSRSESGARACRDPSRAPRPPRAAVSVAGPPRSRRPRRLRRRRTPRRRCRAPTRARRRPIDPPSPSPIRRRHRPDAAARPHPPDHRGRAARRRGAAGARGHARPPGAPRTTGRSRAGAATLLALVWANLPLSGLLRSRCGNTCCWSLDLRCYNRQGPGPLGRRRPDGAVLLRRRPRGAARAVDGRADRPAPPARARARGAGRARSCRR